MNITPQQARQAFYRAAANIEARPELYDFMSTKVGDGGCPTCMWGHVGRALGLPARTSSWNLDGNVASRMGMRAHDMGNLDEELTTRGRYLRAQLNDASAAAEVVRAFADFHWPAESIQPIRPDLVECGQSFTQLMESMSERAAS